MKFNFDPHVGLYIDDENCQACTHWDNCPRTYTACSKKMGWQWAIGTWVQPKEKVFDTDNVGC